MVVQRVKREEQMEDEVTGVTGVTQPAFFIFSTQLSHLRVWTEEGDKEEKENERGS